MPSHWSLWVWMLSCGVGGKDCSAIQGGAVVLMIGGRCSHIRTVPCSAQASRDWRYSAGLLQLNRSRASSFKPTAVAMQQEQQQAPADMFLGKGPMPRLGLGLAALGRPGYINLGHGADLASGKAVDEMQENCWACLDAAWSLGIRCAPTAVGRRSLWLLPLSQNRTSVQGKPVWNDGTCWRNDSLMIATIKAARSCWCQCLVPP